MMGAVSPAVRLTCRMTPVRMPLIELGKTMDLMVCQRVAPTFQHASRKLTGTEASASLVEAMMTGSVMMASVSEAAIIERSSRAKSTNAPRPKSACTMLGTPARLTTARLMMRVNQFSLAYSLRYTAARMPMGALTSSEMPTSQNVPSSALQMPPFLMPSVGFVVRKSHEMSEAP